MNREYAVNQLKAVFQSLSEDIEEARAYGREKPTNFAHRSLFRTHFAFIEGMAFQLRQVALFSVNEHPDFFAPGEMAILKEEKYFLSKKGEVDKQDNFQKLLPSILFSIRCYCRIHGAEFESNTGIQGWSSLQKYLDVRNQLMHPKSIADLEITEEKLKNCTEGAQWFKDTLLAMFDACNKADRKY
jgi:hypothetical protein